MKQHGHDSQPQAGGAAASGEYDFGRDYERRRLVTVALLTEVRRAARARSWRRRIWRGQLLVTWCYWIYLRSNYIILLPDVGLLPLTPRCGWFCRQEEKWRFDKEGYLVVRGAVAVGVSEPTAQPDPAGK